MKDLKCKNFQTIRLSQVLPSFSSFFLDEVKISNEGKKYDFKRSVLVHMPNTINFGYNPKIPFTQRLLVFSIPIEGALHEYG